MRSMVIYGGVCAVKYGAEQDIYLSTLHGHYFNLLILYLTVNSDTLTRKSSYPATTIFRDLLRSNEYLIRLSDNKLVVEPVGGMTIGGAEVVATPDDVTVPEKVPPGVEPLT